MKKKHAEKRKLSRAKNAKRKQHKYDEDETTCKLNTKKHNNHGSREEE